MPLQLLIEPQKRSSTSKVTPTNKDNAFEEEQHPMALTTISPDPQGQSCVHVQYKPVIIQAEVDNENEEAVQVTMSCT